MISSQLSRQAAAHELLRRREARAHLLPFVRYKKPGYIVNWHHARLCAYLDRFVTGEIKKLMINMPPQHGKSELVSRELPAFLFGKNPDNKIIAASYAASLIEGMNRDVQRLIDSPEYTRLFPETTLNGANVRTVTGSWLRNSEVFEIVDHEGSYKCAGVGGSLTGFPADIGIIDDPYKDYQEAMSETVRTGVQEWYTAVFLSRTHVDTRQLITQTRWHEMDLSGWLLAIEGDAREGGEWTVLSLAAICEEEDLANPEEIRQVGEALWPEKFPADMLLGRKRLNARQFHALYQQRPKPKSGNMFDRSLVRIVDAVPYHAERVRHWDMAATEDGGDWTVSVLMVRAGGDFYIEDYIAVQYGVTKRNALIRSTAARDHARYQGSVLTTGPQDPGAAGVEAAIAFMKNLAGFRCDVAIESGSKELRAEPLSDQWGAGNIALLRAAWNEQYLDRMEGFPHSGKDEGDASSSSFNRLALGLEQELDQMLVMEDRVEISSY